jgi:hypothetical protein
MSGSGGVQLGGVRRSRPLRLTPKASFLASEQMQMKRVGATFDSTVVTADAQGNKILEAGTFVSQITANQKYGPYKPAVNEVQTATITGVPTGGAFRLTYGGQQTGNLPFNATAAAVQAALTALSSVGPYNVLVTGANGGPYTVTFVGELAGLDVTAITASHTFTGGTTPNIAIAQTTTGGAGAAPSDGRQTPSDDTSGYLLEDINLRDGDVMAGVMLRGSVLSARVFPVLDSTIRAAVKGRIIFQ